MTTLCDDRTNWHYQYHDFRVTHVISIMLKLLRKMSRILATAYLNAQADMRARIFRSPVPLLPADDRCFIRSHRFIFAVLPTLLLFRQ